MTKTIIALAGGALLATTSLAVQTMAQTPPETPAAAMPAPGDAATIARGAQAWADHCGRCHNIRSPSELNAELWDVSVTHMRVRANLPGSIARDIKAFLMSSAEANVTYTPRAAAGAAAISYAYLKPGDPVRGKEVYSQTCIACHGADGKGAIEGLPDFTMANGRLTKPDDVLLTHMIHGYQSEGSLMAMPPLGGNPDFTEQDMADVLAYLRKEFQKKP